MRQYTKRWVPPVVLGATAVSFAAAMALLVAQSLLRPDLPEFAPGHSTTAPSAGRLVGTAIYTIDARSNRKWRFFRFAPGGALDGPVPSRWDLAVQRHRLIVNGGAGFGGSAGIMDLGAVPFDSVDVVPDSGYLTTRVTSDSAVAGLDKWYDYGFVSHLLTPKRHVYAVRTADGRYAKLEVLSYYCTGGVPGCLTIRYAYQPDGSRRVSGR